MLPKVCGHFNMRRLERPGLWNAGVTVISFMRAKRTVPGEIITGLWVGQQRVLDAPRGLLDVGPSGALYFTSASAKTL
jgi:hypothetical protein